MVDWLIFGYCFFKMKFDSMATRAYQQQTQAKFLTRWRTAFKESQQLRTAISLWTVSTQAKFFEHWFARYWSII